MTHQRVSDIDAERPSHRIRDGIVVGVTVSIILAALALFWNQPGFRSWRFIARDWFFRQSLPLWGLVVLLIALGLPLTLWVRHRIAEARLHIVWPEETEPEPTLADLDAALGDAPLQVLRTFTNADQQQRDDVRRRLQAPLDHLLLTGALDGLVHIGFLEFGRHWYTDNPQYVLSSRGRRHLLRERLARPF